MKYLLLILISCFSNLSFAYWEVKNETNDWITYYFKKDTYKTFFGGSEVSMLTDLKRPDFVYVCRGCGHDGLTKESYLSSRSSWEYDCSNNRFRLLKTQYYSGQMGQGVLLNEGKSNSDWAKNIPNSDRILFCGK